MLVQVLGAVGGVGASTFAWCLARVLRAYAFDFAVHPGGLAWVAGGVDQPAGWPQFSGSVIPATEWLGRAAASEGVHWFSGGSPPAESVAAELLRVASDERAVVVDGRWPVAASAELRGLPVPARIVCATNSLRAWQAASEQPADAYWVRLLPGGIPLAQVSAQSSVPVFAAKSESAVAQAVELGLGVPRGARIARECGLIADWLRSRDG